MSERRSVKRTKMVLPVKIAIGGATQLAHTFDLTYVGAKLGGLHGELKQGQVISLQRGAKRADFRVMWVQQVNPSEVHAGVQAVEKQNNFWGVDLSEADRETKAEVVMSMLSNKAKA